jgi:hypothetical protein
MRALETAASTTFQAHVRDDRDTPSPRAGTDQYMPLIWVFGKAEYFLFWGLTWFPKIRIDLPDGLICRSVNQRM